MRRLHLVSDHTGLTVEAMARALMAQFPDLEVAFVRHSFVDGPEALDDVIAAAVQDSEALVFSSLVNPVMRARLRAACPGRLFDFFDDYTPPPGSHPGATRPTRRRPAARHRRPQ